MERDMIDSTKENELWIKQIEGFEDSLITKNGAVWSRAVKKWRKFEKSGSGYLQVALQKDGKLYQPYIHRLVFETFVRKLQPNEEVHHKNHIPTDNRVENLQAVDREEHKRKHAIENGLGYYELNQQQNERRIQKLKSVWTQQKRRQLSKKNKGHKGHVWTQQQRIKQRERMLGNKIRLGKKKIRKQLY